MKKPRNYLMLKDVKVMELCGRKIDGAFKIVIAISLVAYISLIFNYGRVMVCSASKGFFCEIYLMSRSKMRHFPINILQSSAFSGSFLWLGNVGRVLLMWFTEYLTQTFFVGVCWLKEGLRILPLREGCHKRFVGLAQSSKKATLPLRLN